MPRAKSLFMDADPLAAFVAFAKPFAHGPFDFGVIDIFRWVWKLKDSRENPQQVRSSVLTNLQDMRPSIGGKVRVVLHRLRNMHPHAAGEMEELACSFWRACGEAALLGWLDLCRHRCCRRERDQDQYQYRYKLHRFGLLL